ncbi:hypothetical protein ACSQ67_014853 [Phaseolus vulgaris]
MHQRMCDQANHHRFDQVFAPNDRITRHFGTVAYELRLTPSSRVHPVFHVSLLRPFKRLGSISESVFKGETRTTSNIQNPQLNSSPTPRQAPHATINAMVPCNPHSTFSHNPCLEPRNPHSTFSRKPSLEPHNQRPSKTPNVQTHLTLHNGPMHLRQPISKIHTYPQLILRHHVTLMPLFLITLSQAPHHRPSSNTFHLVTHLTLIPKTLIKGSRSVESPMNVSDPPKHGNTPLQPIQPIPLPNAPNQGPSSVQQFKHH